MALSKNRTSIYLGLAAASAGGYYLYRAGGDVKGAKHEMKGVFFQTRMDLRYYYPCFVRELTCDPVPS